jgi:hypothetical protein
MPPWPKSTPLGRGEQIAHWSIRKSCRHRPSDIGPHPLWCFVGLVRHPGDSRPGGCPLPRLRSLRQSQIATLRDASVDGIDNWRSARCRGRTPRQLQSSSYSAAWIRVWAQRPRQFGGPSWRRLESWKAGSTQRDVVASFADSLSPPSDEGSQPAVTAPPALETSSIQVAPGAKATGSPSTLVSRTGSPDDVLGPGGRDSVIR